MQNFTLFKSTKVFCLILSILYYSHGYSQGVITSSASSLTINGCRDGNSSSVPFTINGTGLTANVVVTAPASLEVSQDGTTYSQTVTLSPVSGSVSSNLLTRVNASPTVGPLNDVIKVVSTNANAVNIVVTGVVAQTPTLILGTDHEYINYGNTSFHLSYDVQHKGVADQYTITPTGPNPMPGFVEITKTLNFSPEIAIPVVNPGPYNFKVNISQSFGAGCVSTTQPYILEVLPKPTGTPILSSNTYVLTKDACSGSAFEFDEFNISGSFIAGNVTVVASSELEVSYDKNDYSSNIDLGRRDGDVDLTVSVRPILAHSAGPLTGTVKVYYNGILSFTVNVVASVVASPSFIIGTISPIPVNAGQFSIPYTLNGTADAYYINPIAPNPLSNLVTTGSLSTSPLRVAIAPTVPGTYTYSLQVEQTTGLGCSSQEVPFSVVITPQAPVINLSNRAINLSGCTGTLNTPAKFIISGNGLTGNVNVSAPAGVELSLDGTTFSSSIVLNSVGGMVDQTLIARAINTATIGNLTGSIYINSTGIAEDSIIVRGSSGEIQSVTLGTVYSVSHNATSFELPLSVNSGVGDQYIISPGLTHPIPGFKTIYNQVTESIQVPIPRTAPGTYDFTIAIANNSGTGCQSPSQPFSVTTIDGNPMIETSENVISGSPCTSSPNSFHYVHLSGSHLLNDITISASAGLEVSVDDKLFNSTIIAKQNNSNVISNLYIRKSLGAAAGLFAGEINLTSTGAQPINISVSGEVLQAPSLSLGSVNAIAATADKFKLPYTLSGLADLYELKPINPNPVVGIDTVTGFFIPNELNISLPVSNPGTYNYSIRAFMGSAGCTSEFVPFTVTVNPRSSNADLSKFDLQLGTNTSTYSPVLPSYSVGVLGTVTSAIITPYSAQSGATIKINGTRVLTGQPSLAIPLTVGLNTITIDVTAEDGTTIKTTTLEITRTAGNIVQSSGGPGTVVTIHVDGISTRTGATVDFTGATNVLFGGVPAKSFVVISSNRIDAIVDHGASGDVQVVTPNATLVPARFIYLSPLPVSFVYLKSTVRNNAIDLSWKIADPSECKAFIIERSEDGIAFKQIGVLSCSSNNSSYSWTDNDPGNGISYYRIQATNIASSQTVYSTILKNVSGSTSGYVSTYPNPVSGGLVTVVFHNMKEGKHSITVADVSGKTVLASSVENKGENKSFKIQLPDNTPTGIYVLKIVTPDSSVITQKIVVKK